jgi:MFS family permease
MTLLRQRDPRILLAVCGLSSIGDFVAFVVLTVRVYEGTGRSGIGVGALLLALVLPGVLMIPLAGWLVDHFETRRVLSMISIGQALVVAGLALTTNLVATFALAFLLGALVAVARPAVFAMLPRVAGDRQLTEINAWYQMVYFGGAALGPAAGGFLLEFAGATPALLLDAATFVVMALGIASLRASRPPAAAGADGHGSSWRQGITVVTGDRVVLIVVVVTTLAILMVGASNVSEVGLAKGVLGAGDIGYGLLNGSWMLGMVLLVTTVARRLRPDQLAPGLLLGMLTASLMTLAAGLAPVIWFAVAVYIVGGGGNGVGNVALRSTIQHRVPEHKLGRAFATFGGMASAADISSSALGGVLVQLFGARGSMVMLGAAGSFTAAAGLIGYLRLPGSVRAMPKDTIDAGKAAAAARADGQVADGRVPDGLAETITPAATTASAAGPAPEAAQLGAKNPQDQAVKGHRRQAAP